MMKSVKFITFASAAAVILTSGYANTLISGNLATGANWDTGLPDTPGNVGIIDADNVFPNQGALTTATGLFIQQTGGAVTGGGIAHTLDSTSYIMTGGVLNLQTLNVNNGSTLTVDGGTVTMGSGRDLVLRSSTFTFSSGTMEVTDQLFGASSGSSSDTFFNFSGGTFTANKFADGFNNVGTYNFSGTADVNANSTGAGTDRIFNFGLGSGTVDISGNLDTTGMTIDWTSDSAFAFTATTINGSATDWEALWTSGNLTINGGQTGAFADHFKVNGDTLTLVPEPSALALLIGILAFGRVMIRRRA